MNYIKGWRHDGTMRLRGCYREMRHRDLILNIATDWHYSLSPYSYLRYREFYSKRDVQCYYSRYSGPLVVISQIGNDSPPKVAVEFLKSGLPMVLKHSRYTIRCWPPSIQIVSTLNSLYEKP